MCHRAVRRGFIEATSVLLLNFRVHNHDQEEFSDGGAPRTERECSMAIGYKRDRPPKTSLPRWSGSEQAWHSPCVVPQVRTIPVLFNEHMRPCAMGSLPVFCSRRVCRRDQRSFLSWFSVARVFPSTVTFAHMLAQRELAMSPRAVLDCSASVGLTSPNRWVSVGFCFEAGEDADATSVQLWMHSLEDR